jgi:hypothetical protein
MNTTARQERIQRIVDDIKDVIEEELAFTDDEEGERIVRWAIYVVAREHLEGHVSLVWVKGHFPDGNDQEVEHDA